MSSAFSRIVLNIAFSITSLLMCLTISWILLAAANFLYPVWHDVGGLGKGIDAYGPQNRYKPGFGDTTKAQRSDLFAQINVAVHNHGKGLERIQYSTPTSRGTQNLLRRDEVIHLRDVANLIDVLKVAALVNAVVWILLALYQYLVLRKFVSLYMQLLSLAAVLISSGAVLVAFGPVKVFHQLHIWIFPDEHKWFFFYRDSLMSTLMMAPTLFGWIAGALVGLTVFIYALFFILAKWASRYTHI